MKNRLKGTCYGICHEVIRTQHVFADNDQVYLKKTITDEAIEDSLDEQWTPINFQWVSDMNVRNSLIHHVSSNTKQ